MERGHKALGLHSALYPRDHALQADANDTLLGDDANRCSQAASSPQPPACFWMHASSWTSLFRLLHFGRAANGLARAGRCEPVPSQHLHHGICVTAANFTTGRTGASWVPSDRLYEIAKGLQETKRREHEDVEKIRVRRWPIEGI
jgi:hypothetical protein